jgi:hypothetical protein
MNESIGHSLRLRERADGSETIMKDYVRIEVCLLLQPGREALCAVLLLPFGTDDIKPLFFHVAISAGRTEQLILPSAFPRRTSSHSCAQAGDGNP